MRIDFVRDPRPNDSCEFETYLKTKRLLIWTFIQHYMELYICDTVTITICVCVYFRWAGTTGYRDLYFISFFMKWPKKNSVCFRINEQVWSVKSSLHKEMKNTSPCVQIKSNSFVALLFFLCKIASFCGFTWNSQFFVLFFCIMMQVV